MGTNKILKLIPKCHVSKYDLLKKILNENESLHDLLKKILIYKIYNSNYLKIYNYNFIEIIY